MRGGFWRSRKRIGLLGAVLVASVMVAVLLTRGSAVADVTTWTIDADFDQGTLQGVNHDAPNQDQLQLNETGSTFPFLWIANAGEDTVSKIDTNTGKELARYHTWFGPPASHSAWSGPAPSRTAVDSDGSVYVANRHFDNRQPQVMKILSTGGIDRNGNGIIETSSDANSDGIISPSEMLPMTDSNGNGTIDPSEIADERVVWAAKAGVVGRLGRSLCIGTDGNIWLGTYSDRNYYKLSSADGSVLSGPHAVGVTTYGCLIDGNGTLWSASLSSLLGEIDTSTGTSSGPHSHGGFGGN